MDDYVWVPHHGAVQGPPDNLGWDYSGRLASNDNVPVAEQPAPPGPSAYLRGPYDPDFRRGDFMQTFTGKQVWPMDMRAEDVDIQDIAHSLAMQCRYAGHSLQFYSVAEHSVHVSDWLLETEGCKRLALAGLLHDASEAYLCDVPRPVKPYLAGYKDAEAAVQRTVHEAFGLPAEIPALVHEADNRILIDERHQNMAPANYEGGWPDVEPLGVRLEFWSPAFAKAVFLMRFSALTVGAGEERVAA